MIPALDIAASTHCGRVRPDNEDSVATHPELGLAVLADGMGGHNAGEVASDMAVRSTLQSLVSGWPSGHAPDEALARSLLIAAIERANEEILRAAYADVRCRGMGTTLVAIVFHGAQVTVAHVGDSRAYRLREGRLVLLTRDHTLVRERFDKGLITLEQARTAPDRNVLTRAVGTDAAIEVDVITEGILDRDLYVLCSDGVHDMLSDPAIERALAEAPAPASAAAEALVRHANAAGGLDNVSAIVARVLSTPHA